MKKLLCAIGASAALGLFSSASATTVAISGTSEALPGPTNNFTSQLETAFGAANLSYLTDPTFALNGPSQITFTAVAAESGLNNDFNVQGLGTLSENGNFSVSNFLTDGVDMLSGIFNAFPIFSFNGNEGEGDVFGGSQIGVFFDGSTDLSEQTVFFLAFDDRIASSADDNHDDFIIRVNIAAIEEVPLPAAGWLFLSAIAGFGFARRK